MRRNISTKNTNNSTTTVIILFADFAPRLPYIRYTISYACHAPRTATLHLIASERPRPQTSSRTKGPELKNDADPKHLSQTIPPESGTSSRSFISDCLRMAAELHGHTYCCLQQPSSLGSAPVEGGACGILRTIA